MKNMMLGEMIDQKIQEKFSFINKVVFHGMIIYMIIMTYFIYYSIHALQFPYTFSEKKLLCFLNLSYVDQIFWYINTWSTELKFRKYNIFFPRTYMEIVKHE